MTLNRRALLGGTAVSASGLLIAGCGGGSTPTTPGTNGGNGGTSAGPSSSAPPSPPAESQINKNGIINLVCSSAFEHLDPQNIYVNTSSAIGRLMFRGLMAYKENPSDGSYVLAPDLAAGMPTSNKDKSVWTFKLKKGQKFADGTTITAADIKYGVERSMDPNIPYGPQYAKQYLAGADKYTGPAKGKDLKSIVVPDANTIEFHLTGPLGTWPDLCTLSTFIPVPKAKDTGKTYDLHPVCSGPYTIQTYQHDTKLVLVPNKYWDKTSDPLRSQHFAQINCQMNVDPNTVDQQLFADAMGGTAAAFIDQPTPGDVAKTASPQFASRVIQGPTIFTWYYTVGQYQPALKDKRVRQALFYAYNPAASIKGLGGPLLGRETQSFAPNSLKGFDPTPVYYPDRGDTGNPDKAKQLLQQAGVSNLRVTLPYSNKGAVSQALAQIVVQAYARAGITVIPKPLDPNSYYTTISTRSSNKFDLISAGWGYDIPDGSTIYPPLFRGGSNIYDGSSNYAAINIPALDKRMEAALKQPPETALKTWQYVDKYIVENALAIPRYQDKTIQMFGSKVKGAYLSPVLGTMDISNAYISNT